MLKPLFEMQREVDELIKVKIADRDILFENTLGRRKVAFFVELGELANEIGFFKYWKESHTKNDIRIKDEWADCLAFLNSIVITQNYTNEVNEYLEHCVLESKLSPAYHFDRLRKNKLYDLTDFEYAYIELYKLGTCMGYSIDQLNEAYQMKTKENIRRAKEGY